MAAKVKTTHTPDLSMKHHQSLFEATVPAGFPSPAADYEEDKRRRLGDAAVEPHRIKFKRFER